MTRLLAFCLMLFPPFFSYAEDLISLDECQNAAASLTYYLEQLYLSVEKQENLSESISFSEENVWALWDTLENFCTHPSYQANALCIKQALQTYQQLDFDKPKEEVFALLFSCFLQLHSVWMNLIGEDLITASLETMQELQEISKELNDIKRLCATRHICSQIQHKLAKPLPEKEKDNLTNLLNWIGFFGPQASRDIWQKWKSYYKSFEKDSLKASTQFSSTSPPFQNNLTLNSKARQKLAPYLLPETHPAKPYLDEIFWHTRATQNAQALKEAGFQTLSIQGRSFIHVLSHPSLPDYLLKVVLDNELRKKRDKPEWEWFARRCLYAKKIAKIIEEHHIQSFTVPKKWAYSLPLNSSLPLTLTRKLKPIALVVQKMELVPFQKTLNAWKNQVKKEQLEELYTIVSKLSRVSIRPDNLPLTTDGKFAFVDTEYVRSSPAYGFIRPYLSAEMRLLWDQLVSKGGK